ncbi:MAG: hypothetical protein KJ667_05645 [Alphaproteobacteria bacterium]|nr:hypothetical protein [Alphaproteobacteria bacterium]
MTTNTPTAEEDQGFSLTGMFSRAANTVWDGIKAVGGLTYDFVKANPIVTAVGADLMFTGGALTQQALVAATKTVGGALGEVGLSAGQGLWNMMLGR